MNWSISPYPYYHMAGTITLLVAAVLTWSRRRLPVARSLLFVLAALAQYSFFAMLEAAAVDLPVKILLSQLEYIGSSLSVPFTVNFAMQLVRPTLRPARWFWPALYLTAALFIGLVWTNDLHHLIWLDVVPGPAGTNSAVYVHGPLFFAYMAYILLTIGAAGVLILRTLFAMPRMYHKQAWVFFGAIFMPLGGTLLYILGINPPGLDISPISFSLAGITITLGITLFGLFDLVPLARHTVIDAMRDGMLILDDQYRLVDFNPSAGNMLRLDSRQIGWPIADVLTGFENVNNLVREIHEVPVEMPLTTPGNHWVEVRVLPMRGQQNRELGRLVLLRDVSMRRTVEEQLRKANDRLQQQLDQIQNLQALLQEQAVRDPLTGLFNRRYLEETLNREVGRAERENYPVSIILIDLDGFKKVNDTHGHAAGDAVLHALGELMMRMVRRGDIPCRMGGEEFLIIMPNATAEIGMRRAEELRLRFDQMGVQFDGQVLKATFSAGVACFPQDAQNTESLLRAADSAMYIAKKRGRNCVARAGDQG